MLNAPVPKETDKTLSIGRIVKSLVMNDDFFVNHHKGQNLVVVYGSQ